MGLPDRPQSASIVRCVGVWCGVVWCGMVWCEPFSPSRAVRQIGRDCRDARLRYSTALFQHTESGVAPRPNMSTGRTCLMLLCCVRACPGGAGGRRGEQVAAQTRDASAGCAAEGVSGIVAQLLRLVLECVPASFRCSLVALPYSACAAVYPLWRGADSHLLHYTRPLTGGRSDCSPRFPSPDVYRQRANLELRPTCDHAPLDHTSWGCPQHSRCGTVLCAEHAFFTPALVSSPSASFYSRLVSPLRQLALDPRNPAAL